jgi:uncharacterized protein YprB with RNaseH-like and TPR domain
LTIRYICRKCGKNHSESEFDASSYCKVCGSFLLKQFSLPTNLDAQNGKRSKERKPLALSDLVVSARGTNFDRGAQSLRQRSNSSKDYDVIHELQTPKEKSSLGSEGWVVKSDYDGALRLKVELIRKFKGKRLEQAIKGEIVSNQQGDCFCVSEDHKVDFDRVGFDESRELLLADLKLLSGIGLARETALRSQGYKTIEALIDHPRWKHQAKEFLDLVETKDAVGLQDHLRSCLPKSHPLVHYLAGLCNDESFAVIDIETLGLFGRPIILLGVAKAYKKKVVTRQFLVRDVSEEASALCEFLSAAGSDSALISFNGRCFDVPYIRERFAFYGLNLHEYFGRLHFDVLHFARRAFQGRFSNCRLETLEGHLGIKRNIDIPGALVPEFYDSYQRSNNVGPLVAIVEHNKQDLVTLTKLFCSLYREWKN